MAKYKIICAAYIHRYPCTYILYFEDLYKSKQYLSKFKPNFT